MTRKLQRSSWRLRLDSGGQISNKQHERCSGIGPYDDRSTLELLGATFLFWMRAVPPWLHRANEGTEKILSAEL